MYKDTEIQIFIHHPGQLIQHLDNPIFRSSFTDYQDDKILLLKLSQSVIVIGRADYNDPCNRSIDNNYDEYLIRDIIYDNDNGSNCVPSYWRKTIKDGSKLQICKSREKHQTIYCYTQNWTHVMHTRSRPCVDMYNIIGWNWLDVESGSSNEVQIKLHYEDQTYQELTRNAAFDLMTLISNIGGFWGIFLGYSMMQLPVTLGKHLRAFMF